MRIFGVEEEPNESVFAKVVSVAEKAGATIFANYVSTCNRLPGRDKSAKPLIAKFVTRDTEDQLMKLLKETSIYVNDDLTPLHAKITRGLRSKNDVRGVV